MTSINWPSSLPDKPRRQGYSYQPMSPVIRTQMESGPPKQRRRFSGKWRGSPITWLMDATQLGTFRTFWDSSLQGGALDFNWPDPEADSGTVRARIKGGEYQARNVGGTLWEVSVDMEWFE